MYTQYFRDKDTGLKITFLLVEKMAKSHVLVISVIWHITVLYQNFMHLSNIFLRQGAEMLRDNTVLICLWVWFNFSVRWLYVLPHEDMQCSFSTGDVNSVLEFSLPTDCPALPKMQHSFTVIDFPVMHSGKALNSYFFFRACHLLITCTTGSTDLICFYLFLGGDWTHNM